VHVRIALVRQHAASERGENLRRGLAEAERAAAAGTRLAASALARRFGIDVVLNLYEREGDLGFAGESFICDPSGRVVAGSPRGEDHVLVADLDLSRLAASHPRRLFIRDRRDELVPRLLGFDKSRTE
jgi:hypothetical protein